MTEIVEVVVETPEQVGQIMTYADYQGIVSAAQE